MTPKLEAAYDELDRLKLQQRTEGGNWLDSQFADHDAKIAAANAAIERIKQKHGSGRMAAKPFGIEDVPMPTIAARTRHPISELEIGQSFAVPFGREESNAKTAFTSYKRHHPGFDYISQRQEDGSRRFWRTA